MGKVGYALIMVFAIEFALILFAKSAIPGTSLYNLVLNPQEWDSLTLINQVLNDVLLIAGVGAIVAGLYFVRNEWIVYAGISSVFLSFGLVIVQFWQIYSAYGLFGDSDKIVLTMLIGGLIIMFIVTVLDFSRGTD